MLCVHVSSYKRDEPVERCSRGKEESDRKLSLATRSLLRPHCWILVSIPAQMAGWWDLQLFSQQRSAAQLFPSHYEIILHSDWHGSPACSQLLDLNICCNATMLTMTIRDGGMKQNSFFFFFLNCNLISIWLSVILFAPLHFSPGTNFKRPLQLK